MGFLQVKASLRLAVRFEGVRTFRGPVPPVVAPLKRGGSNDSEDRDQKPSDLILIFCQVTLSVLISHVTPAGATGM